MATNPPAPVPTHDVLRLNATLLRRPIREGRYTFHFTYLHPQPTNQAAIDKTCGMLVAAGELLNYDVHSEQHGNSLINAAFLLFDEDKVEAAITSYSTAVQGAMNGSGGRSGAVVLTMRAVFHLGDTLRCPNAGMEVQKLAEHLFEKSEIERGQDEVMKSP